MRTRLSILSLLILFVSVQTIFAQTRVEKRAKQRANQNVDRKVDEAVDNVFKGIFKKKKKKATEADPNVTGTENEPVLLEDDGPWEPIRNEVLLSFVMDMQLTKKNGKQEKYTIQMVFDEWQIGMASQTEDGKARFILDNQDGTMTTITDNEGQDPQGFKMKQRGIRQAISEHDTGEYSITKTGNKRTIDGYATEEYQIEHQEGITNVWVTQDIEADYTGLMQIWQSQQKQKGMGNTLLYSELEGFPIEATTVDKKGQITTMHYRDIQTGKNIDRSPLDVTGVKITKLGM